jgi:exonuclease SbcC
MIPLQLRISGFLSYRDPVEIDFTAFDLACISGQNGAGKSSLLDAMTWVLFGQARKRDDSLVNLQSKAAEVVLTFEYEGNVYRVQRVLPRGKTTILEFQIRESPTGTNGQDSNDIGWKPLTERTLRETQARIEQTLRLDYETFINASFFLQGNADQFTQQSASKRKEVLGTILGLEVWDTYRALTFEKRKALEEEAGGIDGRITEIDAELAEEEPRKKHLQELGEQLTLLTSARKTQETVLENIKKTAASLDQQRRLVETLAAAIERSRAHISGLQSRLSEREAVRAVDIGLIQRSKEIESAYRTWQKNRADLEEWNKVASTFREQERDRAPFLEQIVAEKARLIEEQRNLLTEQAAIHEQESEIGILKTEVENSRKLQTEAEAKVVERGQFDLKRNNARERLAEIKAENEALKIEMDELKARIETLDSTEGATCPLCGQPLSPQHRKVTLKQLQADGKEKGDRFRANKSTSEELTVNIKALESKIGLLSSADNERLIHSNSTAQLTERLDRLNSLSRDWEINGRKRLKEVEKVLESEKYAVDAQKQLARLDKQLAKLGYDAAAHDATRRTELEGRISDEEYRKLETTRATLAQLDNEIQNLKSEINNQQLEMDRQETEYKSVRANLEFALEQTPDPDEAERVLFNMQEQENALNQEVGAARQKVTVLDGLLARKVDFKYALEKLARQIGQHKTLERAFGKAGVPALLIEQVLPEIESKSNELLDRLSNGQMSVRFVTQAEYKDRKREDLKETLDIQISDAAGVRDYEMYSGGEAFRVNFAIRLALAEVLAQRKGARLQTLIIDEGFGSQDIQGRQRLIEAINLVKSDFSKILVITHLDELKDAFPTRIEVEKTDTGSKVTVV